MKKDINKALAKLQFYGMNKSFSVETVNVGDIPKSWTEFPETKDLWRSVNYPKDVNCTGALYKGQKGSIFKGHSHEFSDEIMSVLNEGGEMHVYTLDWNVVLKYGESCYIPKGLPHLAIFKEETIVNIVWHPAMLDGWNADFQE